MSGKQKRGGSAGTHQAWVAACRPGAQRLIAELWQPEHRYAFINPPLRRLSKSGRVVSDSRPEKNRVRLNRFYELRHELSVGLSSGKSSVESIRGRLDASEFAGQLLLAASEAEAVEYLAECLIHNNAIVDGEFGGCVLWIETWRD